MNASNLTPYQEALGSTLIDRTVREKIVLVAAFNKMLAHDKRILVDPETCFQRCGEELALTVVAALELLHRG